MRPRDGDAVFLERLAEHFERAAIEFGQFVEKKDAVVGEADLAGGRRAAAADQARFADRVVRSAERAQKHQRLIGSQPADGAVDAGRFDALFRREVGQDRAQSLGQQRLSRARDCRSSEDDASRPRRR